MKMLSFFAATAAIGALAVPAAAQYNPQPYPQTATPQPYPGQPGYGYGYPQQTYPQTGYGYPQTGYGYPQQQGGVAGIIAQLLGNRYATNDRTAITQCATAAAAEASRRYGSAYGQSPYGQPAYGQAPYGNAYGYGQPMADQTRVTAITNVERRNNGLRVTGLIDTGANGYGQPPYGNAYGYNQQAYAQGDLRFRCNVDFAGRVTNVRLNRVRG